ncbi:MAG: hypothetical protein QXK51_08665 [Candidatus Methanomethylicia archaeon]
MLCYLKIVFDMGYIYVDIILKGRISRSIRALVDTGSAYIVVDPKTISEIELYETPFEVELTLTDKRRVKAKLYLAEVEAEGRRGQSSWLNSMYPHP